MNFIHSLFIIIFSSQAFALEVHGHRGARGARPENTIEAFEYALAAGADYLELDTVVTKDDHVIVAHDLKINWDLCQLKADAPSLDKKSYFRQLTLKQVKSLDCGSKINPDFPQQLPQPGASIPTLEEVLALIQERPKVKLNIEMKLKMNDAEVSPAPAHFARLVLDIVYEMKLLERIILQSFIHDSLYKAREFEPNIQLSALVRQVDTKIISALEKKKVHIISPHYSQINKRLVQEIHERSMKVIPWTANKERDWQTLVELEVDGIITDYPSKLIQFLSPERQ